MMRMIAGAALAAAALAAVPAQAQDGTAYRAIARGDFARAERQLAALRGRDATRPELMLNLAAVYRHDGRTAQARDLYAQVLAAHPVLLDLPSGRVATSHAVARYGLRTLEAAPSYASR